MIEVIPGKFEILTLASLFHQIHEPAPNHQRQDPRFEQVVAFAGYPRSSIVFPLK
jgi:hypothetical protein